MPSAPQARQYRYYDFVMAAYVCVLLCSNLMGPAKETSFQVPILGTVTFGAGVLFFPISYIFGDILTEVYGYARSRKVVWTGFVVMGFATFFTWFILMLPPAKDWPYQSAFEIAFASAPRIVVASMIAYFAGEFANSYTLAKMK